MTKRNHTLDLFPMVQGRKIEVDFEGGEVTSNGGALLLGLADRALGSLSHRIARCIPDTRRKSSCTHSLPSMVRQAVYSLCLGQEDLVDQRNMRHDIALQTAVGQDKPLASDSTLGRVSRLATPQTNWKLNEILVDTYIESHKGNVPQEIVLDFDATDVQLHGTQEGRFFHGHYDGYCYLPLFVFAGKHPLCAILRPADRGPARGALAVLAELVHRLRRAWPGVRIVWRADAAYCRDHILHWCERHDVSYVVGLQPNSALDKKSIGLRMEADELFLQTAQWQKLFDEFRYQAGPWKAQRRVVVKAERNPLGPNTRYVVTNLPGDPDHVYTKVYCARGEMENRFKETQADLFGSRLSHGGFQDNWMRMLMSVMAYLLQHTLRSIGLKGEKEERSTCSTIRIKLLKIGAVVTRNTRRIRMHLSSSHPDEGLFRKAFERLAIAARLRGSPAPALG
ncbi:MAG: IS1380 family transposase [Fibrobacteria bacterium]|nr:IS1380 family transposase [Fibrobacteria bacterium]